ncbi:MAG: VWA domain-containing protein [Pseudomonadota bacterium]
MNDWSATLQNFHLLRPWWLLTVPAMAILWWRVRSATTPGRSVPDGIAPHLAKALAVGDEGTRRFLPIDGMAVTIVLLALAASGPTWSRVPNPLVSETAPLAIALKVSDTMLRRDVAPSRLERAKHKILDLIESRPGGRTALVAYAGSAHRVVPLTEDPAIVKPFLEGLSPDVMPASGQNATAALTIALDVLRSDDTPGAILFVLDDLDRADIPAFERHAGDGGAGVVFLIVGGSDASRSQVERVPGASVVELTSDATDVLQIGRRIASAYRDALVKDDRQQWDDRGWLFAWPAALLALVWFRRGWTMRWAAILVATFASLPLEPAKADGLAAWFLTPDQQGRLAYQRKDFAGAAARFEDPMWQGYSLYRAGKYAEAAETLARLPTAEAAFIQGMAQLRNRAYRDGIRAFETALERDPEHKAATRNLQIARAILAYVERVREQSDTGEESGIGADDVVFDNESGRGADTTVAGDGETRMETAEEWMRTVDTRTADFLRTRFALEAAGAGR